ncbi:hypothetical protein EDC01DRAFT_61834 [Geopyxis carbonaria]|nr:hypothetical protein EDC01DRAFT_61834 [Geopyxis carbonaria]
MPHSLESSRPMIPKRDTRRFSNYTAISSTPSITSSTETSTFNDIDDGLRRLEDRRLMSQRFVPSEKKSETLSKLALGAKLERALRWRMDGQDYVPRPVKSG